MPRTRTIYNNQALLVGPSPSTGVHTTGNIKKLHRVQSIGNSVEYPLENVNEYGKMAAIDRLNMEGSNSNMEFSHYVSDLENEFNLGFNINSSSSAITPIADKSQGDKNYFRFVAPEGIDANGLSATGGAVLAIGNGFIASYSFEASVGSFPMASVSVQGLNTAATVDGNAKPIPAVDPVTGRKASGTFTLPVIPESNSAKPSAIRPGEVKVTFSNEKAGLFQTLDSAVNVQSVNFNFDFNLEPTRKLGSLASVARDIQFPIDIQISVESLLGDMTATTGLVEFMCNQPSTDITIDLYKPSCDANGATTVGSDIFAKFIIKNAKLTSQNLSGSLGPADTVSMQFISQVGGSSDTLNGIFFSGVTGYSGVTPLKSL